MIIKWSKIRFFCFFLLECCIMIIVPFIMHNMKNNSNSLKSWQLQSSLALS